MNYNRQSDFEDYVKLTDTVEGIRVTKQMVINTKTGVIQPKYNQHYVSLKSYETNKNLSSEELMEEGIYKEEQLLLRKRLTSS